MPPSIADRYFCLHGMEEIVIIVEMIIVASLLMLHLFGIHLLHLAKDSALQDTQRLFYMHLSISEALILLMGIVRRTGMLCQNHDAFLYPTLIQQGLALPLYYMVMISLTLDRFFSVYLNLRYPLFWSDRRTKYLLTCIWCISIAVLCIFLILKPPQAILLAYYFNSCGIICISTAVFTYSYISYKVFNNWKDHNRRVQSLSTKAKSTEHESATASNTVAASSRKDIEQRHRPKGLYSVGLLVLTFVVFIAIPDQIYAYHARNNLQMPLNTRIVVNTMYFVAFASDFFIYAFSSKAIRKIAANQFHFRKIQRH